MSKYLTINRMDNTIKLIGIINFNYASFGNYIWQVGFNNFHSRIAIC